MFLFLYFFLPFARGCGREAGNYCGANVHIIWKAIFLYLQYPDIRSWVEPVAVLDTRDRVVLQLDRVKSARHLEGIIEFIQWEVKQISIWGLNIT